MSLPTSFGDALEALAADKLIVDAMGEELVETFKVIKAAELDRYRAWVTDWEFAEYSPRL
jgi:glutamine synthetase